MSARMQMKRNVTPRTCGYVRRARSAHWRTADRLPDLTNIAHRRCAELPEIFAAELRGALVADRESHIAKLMGTFEVEGDCIIAWRGRAGSRTFPRGTTWAGHAWGKVP